MPSFTSVAVFALVGINVAAGQLAGISSTCQTTLTNLLFSPASSCLDVLDAAAVVSTPNGTSIIGPLNTWLTNVCPVTPCSNATLAATITNVTTGCSSDLGTLGIGEVNAAEIIPEVQYYYPTAREVLCSKSNNAFCLTSTLTVLQGALGAPLDMTTLMSPTAILGVLANASTAIECTDCLQSAYAIVKMAMPELSGSSFESSLASKCGSHFVDGGVAGDVTVPSAAATTSAANAASGLAPSTFLPAALVSLLVAGSVALGSGFFMML